MKFLIRSLLFIGLLSFLISCRIFKTPDNSVANDSINQSQVLTPKILMLNFEISSNDSIRLVNSMVTSGKLRKQEYLDSVNKSGDLVLTFLDNSENLCSKLIIPNPLIKKAEFSDDFKTIQVKIVKLDKAFFSVRVQFEKCMNRILVEKTLETPAKSLVKLVEIPLIIDQNE
jgi:hypothetical protein